MTPPNKTLHTNRRPALDFGLSDGLFDAAQPHHITVRAAVGDRWDNTRTTQQAYALPKD